MSFKDYQNLAMVLEKYQVKYQKQDFIQPTNFPIAQTFLDDFNFAQENIEVRVSENSICENIIYPILKEVYKKYAENLWLWSHKTIAYDDTLSGAPNYLVSTKSELGNITVGKPLLLLVEAKKNDFEEGWGQCSAEMVAVQKLNNDASLTIYGMVSDGEVWRFGKLWKDEFTDNRTFFTINKLDELFGAIDFVFDNLNQTVTKIRSLAA